MNRAHLLRSAGILLLATAIAAAAFLLPVREGLGRLIVGVKDFGPWGPVLFGALYIPACLLFVPGSVLTMASGFLFGVVTGSLAVSIGSTLGASAAFWVGRTLARDRIEARVSGNPRFGAIDRAVGERGFLIVLLTRLSPVFPFNLLNYAYGLTRVRFRDYFFASWIGMFPGTVLYVYLGSAVKNFADILEGRVEGGTGGTILFSVGLAATIAVTVLVTRIARKALRDVAPEAESVGAARNETQRREGAKTQ